MKIRCPKCGSRALGVCTVQISQLEVIKSDGILELAEADENDYDVGPYLRDVNGHIVLACLDCAHEWGQPGVKDREVSS